MTIFEAVKSTVTPRMAAEHFELSVSRNGMACCSFHRDMHPSMKFYFTTQQSRFARECIGFAVFISKIRRNDMNIRNEIKAQIVRAGFTMQELVDRLADEYDWSDSVSNLSAKLQRESIRYKEVVELADVLGYDIVWQKRRDNR